MPAIPTITGLPITVHRPVTFRRLSPMDMRRLPPMRMARRLSPMNMRRHPPLTTVQAQVLRAATNYTYSIRVRALAPSRFHADSPGAVGLTYHLPEARCRLWANLWRVHHWKRCRVSAKHGTPDVAPCAMSQRRRYGPG